MGTAPPSARALPVASPAAHTIVTRASDTALSTFPFIEE
jgi:hypothetical protein